MQEQALTIYFDLSPEARPTIGSIGKAMVEFEKMAGEAIYLVEPGTDFTMVYQYSAPGSLRIIAGLRGLVTTERLKILAVIVATTLINNGIGHIQGIAMDEAIKAVVGDEMVLTDEDIARIAEAVKNVEKSETVKAPRREFYQSVQRDEAIVGIGAAPGESEEPPAIIVPRAGFDEEAVKKALVEAVDLSNDREISKRQEVVLVQAPLIDSNRQWKVFFDGREFGAKMLHQEFKQQILSGETDLKLAGGVILDVTIEITQERIDGLWHNRSFAITKVHGWRQNPEQAEMLLTHRDDENE